MKSKTVPGIDIGYIICKWKIENKENDERSSRLCTQNQNREQHRGDGPCHEPYTPTRR